MKKTLYTIVDSRSYVKSNCYQHQMMESLGNRFDLRLLEISELGSLPSGVVVLSCLKLRTVDTRRGELKRALGDRQVIVYDQDPWEGLFAPAPSRLYCGAYRRIYDTLNVLTFLNVSHWWRDRVIEFGMPSTFVQIWTLPRYCRTGEGTAPKPVQWSKRTHEAVFCGTMYPRRREFFDALEGFGVKVEVISAGRDYQSYLDIIADSKVAIRSEWVDWAMQFASGTTTIRSTNALWKRDIETAAQGCFSMRDADDEMKYWIDGIPTIVPFTSVEEAAHNVRNVLAMPAEVADPLVIQGIDTVRSAPGWSQLCDVVDDLIP